MSQITPTNNLVKYPTGRKESLKATDTVKDVDLIIDGYKFVRRERPYENGSGGFLLYYMNEIHLTENPLFLSHEIDNFISFTKACPVSHVSPTNRHAIRWQSRQALNIV